MNSSFKVRQEKRKNNSQTKIMIAGDFPLLHQFLFFSKNPFHDFSMENTCWNNDSTGAGSMFYFNNSKEAEIELLKKTRSLMLCKKSPKFMIGDKRFRAGRIILSLLLFIGIYLSLCFSNGRIKERILEVFNFSVFQKNCLTVGQSDPRIGLNIQIGLNAQTRSDDDILMPLDIESRCISSQDKKSFEKLAVEKEDNSNSRYMKYFTNKPPLKYSSNMSVKGILPAVPVTESPGLTALNWLRGAWQIDLGDTVLQINVSPSDEGGNYLIGRKESRLTDGSLLWIAILIIVRNPISELYETWEFRSDGSFGGGIMEQFGPQWSAPMKYILADGRTMTAVVTFTPQAGGGFIWQENSRTLSELPLPALGPINARPLAPTGRESFFR